MRPGESRDAAPEMSLKEHPLRRQVVDEMQLRRFPDFALPAHIVQIVRIVEDRAAEAQTLSAIWPDLAPTARSAEAVLDSRTRLCWERHSEASTVTLVSTDGERSSAWAAPPAIAVLEALAGEVVRASHVIVVTNDAAAEDVVHAAAFAPAQLVTCFVSAPCGASARVWTDFRIHGDGYGRMVVVANGMAVEDLRRCVQQLQELGNYRNLALIGLPAARAAWAELDIVEVALDQVGQSLVRGSLRDDELLASLTALSARILSIDSGCSYRMSATAAYARIVASRLRQLRATPIAGYQSLADFTQRRFDPAVYSCAALTDRLALLNGRAAQFTALLRARIETHIEEQNAQLLCSMESSARMQLRLQHLVEGLSAVAISYYALGLIAYPLKAAEKHWPAFPAVSALGLLAPLVALTALVAMKHVRHRLVSDDKPTRSRP